jgi:hypothetical protein
VCPPAARAALLPLLMLLDAVRVSPLWPAIRGGVPAADSSPRPASLPRSSLQRADDATEWIVDRCVDVTPPLVTTAPGATPYGSRREEDGKAARLLGVRGTSVTTGVGASESLPLAPELSSAPVSTPSGSTSSGA